MDIFKLNGNQKLILYTAEEIAEKFKVSIHWLEKNKKWPVGYHHVPVYRLTERTIRYEHKELLEWLGREYRDLELLTTKQLAGQLKLKVDWIKRNRLGDDPIPFRRIGGHVRYNLILVRRWLRKHMVKSSVTPKSA